jgi:aspartyl-tRNA(Asn)/glutamyl-tRNA(Gln) amidotransferase subunit B
VAGRTKESAHDYRYFPEPDLPLLRISEAWVDAIRARMPVLPTARRERYVADLGLPHRVARILVADPGVADWFDQAVAAAQERDLSLQALSHWVTGEMFHLMKVHGAEIGELPVSPHTLVALVALVEHGTLSPSNAKDVLAEMAATGASPGVIVEAWGLVQISDRERLQQVVNQVLAAHPDQVADYRAGKQALFRWFVGQVMRATRDQAHVPLVIDLLHGALEEPGP